MFKWVAATVVALAVILIGCAGLQLKGTCNYSDCDYVCIADQYPEKNDQFGLMKLGEANVSGTDGCTYINLGEWEMPPAMVSNPVMDRGWFVWLDTDAMDGDLNGEADLVMEVYLLSTDQHIPPEARGKLWVATIYDPAQIEYADSVIFQQFGVHIEPVWAKKMEIPDGWTPCAGRFDKSESL